MATKQAIVVGSGFAGLSAATFLSNAGYKTIVLEKNDQLGGRARQLSVKGFKFDMGPSWYWMPDVFERYFSRFNKSTSDYYKLTRLDPSYSVVFDENDKLDIPANYHTLRACFETIEKGSARNLDKFLEEAAFKYKVGINDLVYKPARSLMEFVNFRLLINMIKMDIFGSFQSHINKYFRGKGPCCHAG